MGLSRDEILAKSDFVVKELEVPEWGGMVFIRSFSGKIRDGFESSLSQNEKTRFVNFRARFAVNVLCDKDGKLLFSESDINLLSEKSGKALDRILDAGMELNGMKNKDMDEALKNSMTGQVAGSISS